ELVLSYGWEHFRSTNWYTRLSLTADLMGSQPRDSTIPLMSSPNQGTAQSFS
ncbi:hypothetical protein SK128_022578, partial [Halocaridina rubra]